MKHISINGAKKLNNLERQLHLKNGALIFQKNNGEVVNVYMVVSFRDNKNRYRGDATAKYCSLVNLDTGYFVFEERCSRNTTVRRVLNHLLNIGCADYVYNASISTEKYGSYDIELYYVGGYSLDISYTKVNENS